MYLIEPQDPKRPARKIFRNGKTEPLNPSFEWKLIDELEIENLEDLYIALNDIDENDKNLAIMPSIPRDVAKGDIFRRKECQDYSINYAQFDIDDFKPRSTRSGEMESPLDMFARIKRELPFIKKKQDV